MIPGQTLVTEIWDLSSEEFLETVVVMCGDGGKLRLRQVLENSVLHCKLCLLRLERGQLIKATFIHFVSRYQQMLFIEFD